MDGDTDIEESQQETDAIDTGHRRQRHQRPIAPLADRQLIPAEPGKKIAAAVFGQHPERRRRHRPAPLTPQRPLAHHRNRHKTAAPGRQLHRQQVPQRRPQGAIERQHHAGRKPDRVQPPQRRHPERQPKEIPQPEPQPARRRRRHHQHRHQPQPGQPTQLKRRKRQRQSKTAQQRRPQAQCLPPPSHQTNQVVARRRLHACSPNYAKKYKIRLYCNLHHPPLHLKTIFLPQRRRERREAYTKTPRGKGGR